MKLAVHLLLSWTVLLIHASYNETDEEKVEPVLCSCTPGHCSNDTSVRTSDETSSKRSVNTCISAYGYCYQQALITDNRVDRRASYHGCIGAHIVRHMCFKSRHRGDGIVIECCNTTLCNRDMTGFSNKLDDEFAPLRVSSEENIIMVILGSVGTLTVVIIAFAIYKIVKSRTFKKLLGHEKELYVAVTKEPQYTNHLVEEVSLSNTSGAGRTQFVQRTISKQAQLIELVGKGRYGEVWKALWRGDPVAIKQFDPRDEQSWTQEVQMYETSWLRHENILGYIASDCKSTASSTRWWIMMEFCQHGSLYEYLSNAKYTPLQFLESVCGIYSGLEHLHSAIFGNNPNNSKPAIAHRDLKTHNILVKNPTKCCIGDLGLAITSTDYKDKVNKSNFQVGTRRYMAPEILDGSANVDNFFTFKAADMFSSAYIVWEMMHVVVIDNELSERTLPFIHEVPGNPTVEDMLQVVVDGEKRPPLPDRWQRNTITRDLCKIIEELWCTDPAARLTALRVKKTLTEMSLHQQDSFPPV